MVVLLVILTFAVCALIGKTTARLPEKPVCPGPRSVRLRRSQRPAPQPTQTRNSAMIWTLGARLFALIAAIALAGLGVLAWFEVESHTKHLEEEAIRGALRLSDTIRRSTRSSMLKNQKDDVYDIVQNVAAQPGIERIRLFKTDGHLLYSTQEDDQDNPAQNREGFCTMCHAETPPTGDAGGCQSRSRIFKNPEGHRTLGLTMPVANEPTCTGAQCHASPDVAPVLAVLDIHLSLKDIDDSLVEQNRDFLLLTYLLMLGIAATCGLFVWRFVHVPVNTLIQGTEQLARGNLSHRIPIQSRTEIGRLAIAFNQMATELDLARLQITDWAHTLEERVEDKTRVLQQAQAKLIQSEKMASLGTLSAAVAHEINNPLSGVLTYTRLLRRLLGDAGPPSERVPDMQKYLEAIASEIERCGKIVSNLLEFSRQSNIQTAPTNLNEVIERALFLIGHKLELQQIELRRDLSAELPHIVCDADQIQQALLALLINALEAMPEGGQLRVDMHTIAPSEEMGDAISIAISDTGYGIAAEDLPHLFEPFFSTKQDGKGVGLGLSVAYGIVQHHGGRIDVQTQIGQGTTIEMILPVQPQSDEHEALVLEETSR